MRNHGLIIPEIQPDHFIFGAGQLQDNPVNPDGRWLSWLPVKENQSSLSNPAFDPQACVSFATANCAETMIARKFGKYINLSDRFLAYASGTTRLGNDPHTVAETLRKKGDVLQADWDYTDLDNTWETFYAVPPQKLYKKAMEFTFEYAFGHSWVTDPTPERLKKALTYSPLTVGVSAWTRDSDGLYYRDGESGHDVMLAGYTDEYWIVYDSYEQNVKHLRKDFTFEAVKRFTIDRNVKVEDPWQKFLTYWRSFFNL